MDREYNPIRTIPSEDCKAFCSWMTESLKLSPATSRSYSSGINNCEQMASQLGLPHTKLYGVKLEEAQKTANMLKKTPLYKQFNKDQHNRLDAALARYMQYLNDDSSHVSLLEETTSSTLLLNDLPWNTILSEFPNGIRNDSFIDCKRLINLINKRYNIELEYSDSLKKTIKRKLCNVGIEYDGIVYSPSLILKDEIKEKIVNFIFDKIDNGENAVYYSRILTEFADDFSDQKIYDKKMLRCYLEKELGELFNFTDTYLFIGESFEDATLTQKLANILSDVRIPISVDYIYEKLPDYSKKEIDGCLASSNLFIRNKPREFFISSAVELTTDEINGIASIIQQEIIKRRFLSWKELLKSIKIGYPDIKNRYPLISEIGLRDVIAHLLCDRFSFNSNIISALDAKLSMPTVYETFAKEHDSFSLSELNDLKNELGSSIYFDTVYSNSLRISQTQFIRKGSLSFDIQTVDAAISRFCNGDYISISDVTSFSSFPYIGYQWNEYLLEHYVFEYSNLFKLLHAGFSAEACVGAIVKKTSSLETFQDVLVDLLASSSINLTAKDSLDYLCKSGYLARRRESSDFWMIVQKAKEKRGDA